MRGWLAALCATAFLVSAVGVAATAFQVGGIFGYPKIEIRTDVLEPIDAGLASLGTAAAGKALHRVAYLGDSMIVSYKPGSTVPQRLQQTLDRGPNEGRFLVASVAAPGMGPFDFYFIADRVAAAQPNQVILPINLSVFSRGWRETFSRPQLAGLLPLKRLPQALLLPLDGIGLTADRLLAYTITVRLGALDAWEQLAREQARLGTARRGVAQRIGTRFGEAAEERFAKEAMRHFADRFDMGNNRQIAPLAIADRFGPVLSGLRQDNPSLEVLAATLAIFESAGIDVLVYINPINVEQLGQAGALPAEGLNQTLATIEELVVHEGARFLDLHDLLGDANFRDAAGHLNDQGTLLLVRSLVPPLVAESRKRSGGR